jgi:hypothetical protein
MAHLRVADDIEPGNDTMSGSVVVIPRGWTARAVLPLGPKNKNVKDGGALCAGKEPTDANDTTYVFAFKGNNTCEFHRYNTITNAWVAKESIPAVNALGKKKRVKKGSSLAFGTDGKVYATKGNNTLEFWEYTPTLGLGARRRLPRVEPGRPALGQASAPSDRRSMSPRMAREIPRGMTVPVPRNGSRKSLPEYAYPWVQKADVPPGAKTCKEGVSAVAVKTGGSDYIYVLKGSGTQEFYRYDIAGKTWDLTLPLAPGGLSGKPYKNGSCLAYDGGDTIYCLKGSYNELAAYSILGRTWVNKGPLPFIAPPGTRKKKVKDGAGMAYYGKSVYSLKGGNTDEFWVFSTTDQLWHVQLQLTAGPRKVKGGGALTFADANRSLYALRGNNTREYWEYGPLSADDSPLAANTGLKSVQGQSAVRSLQFALSVTPNPFTSSLNPSISYSLPRAGNMSLRLYDVTGTLVGTLVSGYHPAGSYSYSLLTTHHSLASGVYLLKFETESYRTTEKLVIE